MIFLRKKKPCTIYSLALVDLSLDHCSDTGSWRKRSCSELEAKKQTYEYIWSDRASWDCCEHLKQRIYSNMATIRIMYHVLISKGSCTYVTWCVTRSWCWRCECVCGSQGLARCAQAGSAWRCPAVLPRAWLCSLWDRGRLSQAWTWSWWATATACRWWRRGLPQVGARPTFCPSKAAHLRIVSSVEYFIRWLLGCSLDVAFWSNSKTCFYDILVKI